MAKKIKAGKDPKGTAGTAVWEKRVKRLEELAKKKAQIEADKKKKATLQQRAKALKDKLK